MDIAEFEKQITQEIPLAGTIGVRIRTLTAAVAILDAPLKPNTNHHLTAFGGSIYCVAVLSCWSLVMASLKERGYSISYVVVQDGHIEYLKPVTTDFSAEATWDDVEHEKFFTTLDRRGRSRVSLTSVVSAGNLECARLKVRFVAEQNLSFSGAPAAKA